MRFLKYLKYRPYRTPEKSGKDGEAIVRYVLGKNIPQERYVLNNVIIENNGHSTQIDHILIDSRGIFVIETKNHGGRVYGSESSLEWRQYLGRNSSPNKFYNPIIQNRQHIEALKNFYNERDLYISLIVFLDAEVHATAKSASIVNILSLQKIMETTTTPHLAPLEIEKIYHIFLEAIANCSTTEEEHISNVKSKIVTKR